MSTESFLYGSYVLVAILHAIYAVTLMVRRNQVQEELTRLKERLAHE